MIHSGLIIVYSVPCIAGAFLQYRTNSIDVKLPAKLSLCLFFVVHVVFFAMGLIELFYTVDTALLLLAMLLVILSRVINGKILYGKNNWNHYFVTVPFMAVIFILYYNNF